MKIAWIIDGPLDRRTGGTIYDAIIVDALRRRGIAVDVCVPPPNDAQSLIRQLARGRYDVIVGDELCFAVLDIVFEHATFARRVLLVHHLTCWEEELPTGIRSRARRLEARALRHADRVIATSPSTRHRLLQEGARAPIHVVRPGSDRLPRLERCPRPDAIDLVFLGSISPRKRVIELVQAFAAASKTARLTLIGPRSRDLRYVERVEGTVRDLDLTDRVSWLGEVDDQVLAERLSEAHALVLPSSLEGYGMAATEALHAGVPVIAAKTTGLIDALATHSDAAVLVGSLEELTRALRDVTHDQTARTRLSDAASRARPTLPTWSDATDEFLCALTD